MHNDTNTNSHVRIVQLVGGVEHSMTIGHDGGLGLLEFVNIYNFNIKNRFVRKMRNKNAKTAF